MTIVVDDSGQSLISSVPPPYSTIYTSKAMGADTTEPCLLGGRLPNAGQKDAGSATAN